MIRVAIRTKVHGNMVSWTSSLSIDGGRTQLVISQFLWKGFSMLDIVLDLPSLVLSRLS